MKGQRARSDPATRSDGHEQSEATYGPMTHVTVLIPHYRSPKFILPCVRSVLRSTHANLTAVVLNDDVPESDKSLRDKLRPVLSRDARLIIKTLGVNRGPYFAREVGRLAAPGLFATADDDDFVHPKWIETSLNHLGNGTGLVVPALHTFFAGETLAAMKQKQPELTKKIYAKDPRNRPYAQPGAPLTPDYVMRAHMIGVFEPKPVDEIGGMYGGVPIRWDTFASSALKMATNIEISDEPIYYRRIRGGSLTTSSTTGVDSTAGEAALAPLRRRWAECFELWDRHQHEELSRDEMLAQVRAVVRREIDPADTVRIAQLSTELREEIASARTQAGRDAAVVLGHIFEPGVGLGESPSPPMTK